VIDTLTGLNIEAKAEHFAVPTITLYLVSPEECSAITSEILREKTPAALQAVKTTLAEWRGKVLTELIPSKIQALKDGVEASKIAEATTRVMDEQAAKQQELVREASAGVEGSKQADMFDAVTAVPVVQEVRAKLKMKAEPLNERGLMNILAFWVREAQETPEQLRKRFSPMFTSVEKAYNSGTLQSLEGVEWKEEIKAPTK